MIGNEQENADFSDQIPLNGSQSQQAPSSSDFTAEFQDIQHDGDSALLPDDSTSQTTETIVPVNNPQLDVNASFYSIDYYRKFFNVTTSQILKRLTKALVPLPGHPFYPEDDVENNKPDLYGPFWICTTVIIAMAATGNMAKYFTSTAIGDFETDFQLLTFAATVFYISTTIIPTVLYLTLHHIGVEKSLVEIISIYGYSLCVYVPASVACIAPYDWIRWPVIVWCFMVSTWFIVKNLFPTDPNLRKRTALVMVGVTLYHAALALITKIYFFSYK